MYELSKNGELLIPLYHGTSSLFSDSILEFGLGSINPIEQFSVRPFMRSLFDLSEALRRNDRSWHDSKYVVQWMLDQEVFETGANFQHGQTYLSPSRRSAVGYALTNRFGSELLTQTYRLFRWLMENKANLLTEMQLDRHPVAKLFKSKPEPILITACQVNLSHLAAEDGGSVEPVVEELSQFLSLFKESPDEVLSKSGVTVNFNFRLIAPLKPSAIKLEYLDQTAEENPYDW